MANRRFIDFPIASTSSDTDIILIWQDGLNKQTTKATLLSGLPEDLEDLNDVVISGLTNGQILRYNSTTGVWENTDQGNLDLNDLNDVTIVSPSNGQVLVYNSSTSKWENSSGGYVPYVGAVTTVDLGAQQLKAGHTTLTTNGSTETLTVNHTSGSGKAINVTKGGAGEGLYVNKTSGSGNAATIVGTLEATTLVKTGGTSAQFLKADGSVDSTTYVPSTRNITINGTTQDLSADRTYNVGTVTSVGLSSSTSGVTIGSSPVTTSGTITLAIATASGSQNGLLSSTDWTTFNNKQNALTNPVTGTGTTNYLPKFTGSTTIGNSQIFDNGTNVGIGTSSPSFQLHVSKAGNTGIFLSNTTGNSAGYLYAGGLDGLEIQSVDSSNSSVKKLMLQHYGGNLLVGTTTDNGARLQVSGTGTFTQLTTLSASGSAALLLKDSSANNKWEIGHVSNSLYFYNYTTGTNPLVITGSTGAATFSSSVTAGGAITSSIANYPQFIFQETTTSTNSLIFYDNVGSPKSLRFRVNGATNLMSINENGNVGIGTSSPIYKLVVSNSGTTGLEIDPGTIISNRNLLINYNRSTSSYSQIQIDASLTILGNQGNVLIGTTTDNGFGKIQVNGNITVAGNVRFSSTGADANRWSVYWNGATGDLIVVNNISDIRAKKDFDYDIKGLETIQKLKPLKFTWKDGTSHSTSVSGRLRQYGFIAQETMEADDYLAWHNKSHDTWGIEQYESFAAVMVKAIQELKQEIDTLKN